MFNGLVIIWMIYLFNVCVNVGIYVCLFLVYRLIKERLKENLLMILVFMKEEILLFFIVMLLLKLVRVLYCLLMIVFV